MCWKRLGNGCAATRVRKERTASPVNRLWGRIKGPSAHQALEEKRGHLQAGYQAVYDAGLTGYLDSNSHVELPACVRARAVDRSVPPPVRMWLGAPVMERRREAGRSGERHIAGYFAGTGQPVTALVRNLVSRSARTGSPAASWR